MSHIQHYHLEIKNMCLLFYPMHHILQHKMLKFLKYRTESVFWTWVSKTLKKKLFYDTLIDVIPKEIVFAQQKQTLNFWIVFFLVYTLRRLTVASPNTTSPPFSSQNLPDVNWWKKCFGRRRKYKKKRWPAYEVYKDRPTC